MQYVRLGVHPTQYHSALMSVNFYDDNQRQDNRNTLPILIYTTIYMNAFLVFVSYPTR